MVSGIGLGRGRVWRHRSRIVAAMAALSLCLLSSSGLPAHGADGVTGRGNAPVARDDRFTTVPGGAVRAPIQAGAIAGGCLGEPISQSANPEGIVPGVGLICPGGGPSLDLSMARSFQLAPGGGSISCVTFGIEQNSGGAWPVEVLLKIGDINGPYDGLTLIAASTVLIPNGGGGALYTAEFPGLPFFGGEDPVVVELVTPSRAPGAGGDGGLIVLGCNSDGQTAPTYIHSISCEVPDFVDVADIGFPETQLAMTVYLDESSISCAICWPGSTLEVEPCGSDLNGGCNQGQLLTCEEQICGTFWYDGTTRDTDWYIFSIEESTCVTWTVFADVEVDVFFIQHGCPNPMVLAGGSGSCPAVVSATLPAGGYVAFVAPKFSEAVIPCGTLRSQYVANLGCDSCEQPCCPHPISITLRSGDPGITCWTPGLPGCFPLSLFGPGGAGGLNLINNACAGPAAVTIDPFTGWQTGLGCDPLAVWMNHVDWAFDFPNNAKSTLYCHPFDVHLGADYDSVCLTFCWMVDDLLGDPPGDNMPVGVFLRNGVTGLITPVPALSGGGYAADNGPVTVNLPLNAITAHGPNELLVYQRDTGCVVSGVIYSARFDFCFSGVTPPVESGCCNPNGPGFTDPACNEIVCAIEPSCCDLWCDEWCEGLASLLCDCCQTCATPPADLVGWWTLDETFGTTAHDSIFGNHGTHINGPLTTSGAVAGALAFDGVNDFVQIPANTTGLKLGVSDFTVDAWIRWDGPTASVNHPIIEQDGYRFRLVFNTGSTSAKLLLWHTGGFTGSSKCLTLTNVIPIDQWVHVAATVDQDPSGNVCTLYVNGVPVHVNSPIGVNNFSSDGAADIGAFLGTGGALSFNGAIDEVQVFRRALSQSEIQAIYAAGSHGKCKHRCHIPWDRAFPAIGPNTMLVPVTICNDSPIDGTFQVDLQSAMPYLECDGPPITGFTVIGPNPVTVPGNSCKVVFVQITKPAGLVPGLVSCYEACVTNVQNGTRVRCSGSVIQSVFVWGELIGDPGGPACCIVFLDGDGNPVGPPPVGEPTGLLMSLSNPSDETVNVPLRIRHQRPSGPIQFDDLEVGEPKYELLVIGPRDSVLVEVAVTFVEAAPLELFDVIFGTDVDGDGEYTDEWSFGFASGPPAAPALPGDLTGDGIVNAADLAQLLASWGACAGCPADLDGDGVVGPSDLAFLLSNWS